MSREFGNANVRIPMFFPELSNANARTLGRLLEPSNATERARSQELCNANGRVHHLEFCSANVRIHRIFPEHCNANVRALGWETLTPSLVRCRV